MSQHFTRCHLRFILGRGLTRTALLFAVLCAHALPAAAQFGDCPSEPVQYGPINGFFGSSDYAYVELPVAMHPCQTFSIAVSVSQAPPPGFPNGGGVGLDAMNSLGESIASATTNSLAGIATIPRTSDAINSPTVDGSLDPSMRLVSLRIQAGIASDTHPVHYSVTFHLNSRPDFNRGGLSFDDAVQLDPSDPTDVVKMSLPANTAPTPRQYFKITLGPKQSIRLTGVSSNRHPTQQSHVSVDLIDVSTLGVLKVFSFSSPAGSIDAPFSTSAYTNSSAEAKQYYLVFRANSAVRLHAATTRVRVFELKLFLESDSSPSGGGSSYLPGSDSSGLSLPIPVGNSIQDVVVIAAYVDTDGVVVAPPNNNSISFKLTNVSAFAGMAMNWPDSRGEPIGGPYLPDITMVGSSSCAPSPSRCRSVSWSGDTATITLEMWDYGAFGTVTATHNLISAAPMRLPKDTDGNWLPDLGWSAYELGVIQATVADGGRSTGEDVDSITTTFPGDGLPAFEEFRGYVVSGQHIRTDPDTRDLFVLSEFLLEGAGDAVGLPLRVHLVASAEHSSRKISFNFQNSGFGGSIPGHFEGTLQLSGEKRQQTIVWITRNQTLPLPPPPNTAAMAAVAPDPGHGVLGPPWTVASAAVFMLRLQASSPTSSSPTVVDAIDSDKLRQTIGHEIGHHLAIDDVPHPQVGNPAIPLCPPTATSVMASNYFTTSTVVDCAWGAIPHQYVLLDLLQLRVR